MNSINALNPLCSNCSGGLSTGLPTGLALNRAGGPSSPLETFFDTQQQLLTQLLGMLIQLMGVSPSSAGSDAQLMGGGAFQPGPGGNAAGPQSLAPSQFEGGTANGRRLAAAALRESTDGDSPGGWCSRDVGQALRDVGLGVDRGDAWAKAGVLARDPRFREVRVPRNQLAKLPPGAIVVWDRGPGMPYGHVSIALGDGREASDKLTPQRSLSTSFRVFMPL